MTARRPLFLLVAVTAAALSIASCGEDDTASGSDLDPAGALDVVDGSTVTVRGIPVEVDGELHLCSSLLESFPPQCGDPSVVVTGFDLDALPGLQSESGVRWVETPVNVRGVISGGVLAADPATPVTDPPTTDPAATDPADGGGYGY